MSRRLYLFVLILTYYGTFCKKYEDESKPAWAKKDIRDYSDADMERLFDQWEEDDEPLEEDELPEHLRKSPKIDLSNLDPSNPESLLKLSKKGKTLMMFVTVSGNPTKEKMEEITTIWQSSLMNNHIQTDRFLIDDSRAIFMFKDGSQAWDAKDFLIEQQLCEVVVLENQNYYGKYSSKDPSDDSKNDSKRNAKQEL